ncbi:MAG: heme-dependent oxidative N-demethylase subunit alpha family protein [Opitutaceae bacterium]
MIPLDELFPAGDFRFHLTLRRGDPRDFFRPSDPTGAILAERKRWLADTPTRYAALRPEDGPMLEEFAGLCAGWIGQSGNLPANPVGIGGAIEPDFLLLSPDADGRFRLRGGALCFPTGWALEEKVGQTMEFIHGVVPGLNVAIGAPIEQFLSRLKPGLAYLRDNWGIAATDELNLHPARRLPPPALPVALDRLWLRVEHQALVALPVTKGVVFGIRIALHRLDAVARDATAAAGLKGALASMAEEMAAYKRLDAVRAELIARL